VVVEWGPITDCIGKDVVDARVVEGGMHERGGRRRRLSQCLIYLFF